MTPTPTPTMTPTNPMTKRRLCMSLFPCGFLRPHVGQSPHPAPSSQLPLTSPIATLPSYLAQRSKLHFIELLLLPPFTGRMPHTSLPSMRRYLLLPAPMPPRSLPQQPTPPSSTTAPITGPGSSAKTTTGGSCSTSATGSALDARAWRRFPAARRRSPIASTRSAAGGARTSITPASPTFYRPSISTSRARRRASFISACRARIRSWTRPGAARRRAGLPC